LEKEGEEKTFRGGAWFGKKKQLSHPKRRGGRHSRRGVVLLEHHLVVEEGEGGCNFDGKERDS